MHWKTRKRGLAARILWLLLAVAVLGSPAGLFADGDEEDTRLEQYHYHPSTQVQEEVQSALETARMGGKLVIIALGAEWCHDSRALGERFSEPSMQRILDENYEILFADVGYLEDQRSVTRPLGYPINFGTPTVLVFDPVSGTLLNFAGVSTWQSAASVPLEEFETYFATLAADWQQGAISPWTPSPSDELKAFTDRNVERLIKAYAALSPLLAAYDADTLESAADFETLWVEVRQFRNQLQEDLTALWLAEADGAAPDDTVSWPEYGPFSWEQATP